MTGSSCWIVSGSSARGIAVSAGLAGCLGIGDGAEATALVIRGLADADKAGCIVLILGASCTVDIEFGAGNFCSTFLAISAGSGGDIGTT